MNQKLWIGIWLGIAISLSGCLESDTDDLDNLLVTLEGNTNLTLFTEAVSLTPFSTVAEQGIVTIFAPNNQAFERYLAEKGYATVMDIPSDTLEFLVGYHFVPGVGNSNEIQSGYYTSNSSNSPDGSGVSMLIEQSNTTLVFNGNTEATRVDIEGINGVIHIINGVLTLPSVQETYQNNSALSVMRNAINQFGLFDSLAAGNSYTIFTPPNEAFTNFLSQKGLAGVSDLPTDEYQQLILRHVLSGNLKIGTLQDKSTPTLADSFPLRVRLGNSAIPSQSFFLVNDSSEVLLGDIQATDGVLHILNRVLTP